MKTKLKNKQAQKFQGVFANMIDIASIVAAEGGKPPKRIQFLPVGSWNTWAYGDVEINQWHLEAMVEAFERGVRKGVPIDVDHDAGAAAGWVTKLTAEEDGLYAEVEWNGKGTELLEDKQYKFFSPEFSFNYIEPATQVSHGPVMIAGSLTNRPLFKEIEALVANESLQGSTDVLLLNQEKNLIIETMQLSEILKKKASELTDEEVAFLKAHESELKKADVKKFSEVLKADEEENEEEEEETNEEEETTEEGDEDEENEEEEDVKGSEAITISAKEYKALQKKADSGHEAMQKVIAMETREEVRKNYLFSESGKKGYFTGKAENKLVEFLMTCSDKQKKGFKELMGMLPKSDLLFSELGKGGSKVNADKSDYENAIQEKITASAKEGDKLSYSKAATLVAKESPELYKAYEESLTSNKK